MKLIHAIAATIAIGGCVSATSALAQSPGQSRSDANGFNPYNGPTVSPYLLLVPQATSSGGTVGTVSAAPGTYQALVRPMLEVRDEKFRQSLSPNQPTGSSASGSQSRNTQTTGFSNTVRPTGHSSTFMNTSHYYSSQRP